MEEKSRIKSTIKFFLTEFLMVFFGVLLAFWVINWGERKRNKEYAENIIQNISDDIRNDSIRVVEAIKMINMQYSMLTSFTSHLRAGQYDSASLYVASCYMSYNLFEPTTESYQSMIYGGDLKLIEDYKIIRQIKEIDHINQQLNHLHGLYYRAVEDIRNTFLCKEDMDDLDFKRFGNRMEFWNRVNFLRDTYLKNYEKTLRHSQSKYNEFLSLVSETKSL